MKLSIIGSGPGGYVAARNINIRTGHFKFRALGKAHIISAGTHCELV